MLTSELERQRNHPIFCLRTYVQMCCTFMKRIILALFANLIPGDVCKTPDTSLKPVLSQQCTCLGSLTHANVINLVNHQNLSFFFMVT